jgi:hypothetical protein
MEGEARGANFGYQRELLQCMSPLMALSGHSTVGAVMSAFGGKGDIAAVVNEVSFRA